MSYLIYAAIVLHLVILWFGVARGLGMVCDYLQSIEKRLEDMDHEEVIRLLAAIANPNPLTHTKGENE